MRKVNLWALGGLLACVAASLFMLFMVALVVVTVGCDDNSYLFEQERPRACNSSRFALRHPCICLDRCSDKMHDDPLPVLTGWLEGCGDSDAECLAKADELCRKDGYGGAVKGTEGRIIKLDGTTECSAECELSGAVVFVGCKS